MDEKYDYLVIGEVGNIAIGAGAAAHGKVCVFERAARWHVRERGLRAEGVWNAAFCRR